MNFRLTPDEEDVVAGFVAAAEGLSFDDGAFVASVACIDNETVTRLTKSFAEGGWLTLPNEEVTLPCITACFKAFQNRLVVFPIPVLESWLACWALQLAGATAGAHDEIRAVLSAEDVLAIPTYASDMSTGRIPWETPELALVLVSDENGGARLYEGDPSKLQARHNVDVDLTGPAMSFSGPSSAWRLVGDLSDADVRLLQSRALCLLGAGSLGQAEALFNKTMEYLKLRVAFDVPIGSFQALKHTSAIVYAELHGADIVNRAVSCAVDMDQDVLQLCHLSRALSASASMMAVQEAVQFHGGFGFTWEGALHYGVRRCVELGMAGESVESSFKRAGQVAMSGEDLVWASDLMVIG